MPDESVVSLGESRENPVRSGPSSGLWQPWALIGGGSERTITKCGIMSSHNVTRARVHTHTHTHTHGNRKTKSQQVHLYKDGDASRTRRSFGHHSGNASIVANYIGREI